MANPSYKQFSTKKYNAWPNAATNKTTNNHHLGLAPPIVKNNTNASQTTNILALLNPTKHLSTTTTA